MNNDLPVALRRSPRRIRDRLSIDRVDPLAQDGDIATTSQQRGESKQRLEKRAKLLENLMSNLDTVVHAEMAAIYYMDNSFLRLFIRLIIHYYGFILLSPQHKQLPYHGLIIGSNILCAFLHTWNARPEAGEATRGYLHGGLLIDFVGQKSPISKLHLVLLDVVTLMLQLLMLAVFVELHKLRFGRLKENASDMAPTEGDFYPTAQDHDAEERGIRRSGDESRDDIELEDLSASNRPTGQDLPSDSAVPASLDYASWSASAIQPGIVYAGEVVLAELSIPDAIRYFASWSVLTGVAG